MQIPQIPIFPSRLWLGSGRALAAITIISIGKMTLVLYVARPGDGLTRAHSHRLFGLQKEKTVIVKMDDVSHVEVVPSRSAHLIADETYSALLLGLTLRRGLHAARTLFTPVFLSNHCLTVSEPNPRPSYFGRSATRLSESNRFSLLIFRNATDFVGVRRDGRSLRRFFERSSSPVSSV